MLPLAGLSEETARVGASVEERATIEEVLESSLFKEASKGEISLLDFFFRHRANLSLWEVDPPYIQYIRYRYHTVGPYNEDTRVVGTDVETSLTAERQTGVGVPLELRNFDLTLGPGFFLVKSFPLLRDAGKVEALEELVGPMAAGLHGPGAVPVSPSFSVPIGCFFGYTEVGSCEIGWFPCGENSTKCIEQRFRCNWEVDCPDGEDERNCLDFSGDNNHTASILRKKVFLWQERHKCSVKDYPHFCLCRMYTKMHCKDANLTQVPQDIGSSVTALDLEGNNLSYLPAGVFRGLNNLTRLFLKDNSLYELPKDVVFDLTSLKQLVLHGNQFNQFDDLLTNIPSLVQLWMSSNLVTLRGRNVSPRAENLQELFLENNIIRRLTISSLEGLSGLISLYLRDNFIDSIEPGAFRDQTILVDLELNNNRIGSLSNDAFLGLQSLKSFYFMRFRYCSYFPKVPDCHPKTDGVSSFENLLVRLELRVAVWLVATLTMVGNFTVLAGRFFTRDDNKLLSLFIRNLAVADLLTGVYLFVIGIKDLQFRSEYHQYAYYWMTSWGCTVTGVLAMTSAEVSVMILAFMSVERWICITWPLRTPKLSIRTARITLSGIWSIGLLISIVPVFYYQTRQGFYGTNGMCFPLHLDDPWVPGWFYSAFIFIGLNQIGVVLILFSYMGMFCSIRLTRAATPVSLGDREFAIRFFFIVFTDCLCWIPIIVLRIMALASFEIQPELYAYVVVVLLPINSALNPFLYTFTTSKFRSQAGRFFYGKADSETTRSSFFRSATYKWSNGRELHHLNADLPAASTVESSVGGESCKAYSITEDSHLQQQQQQQQLKTETKV
ncbi:relaxin receptor 2-like [Palaemon carinicauda]|uniref:relaxin receptor 2-like n=1 Tax=Palaemon carinicauda TaxID=392227 RepID=UPI0035B57331